MAKKGLSSAITVNELKQDIDPDPITRKLRSDNKKLKHRVEELKLIIGEEQDLFSLIKDAIVEVDPVKISYTPDKTPRKVTSPVSAVLQFSDWHIGAVIDEDEIEGFNAYNYDIATKRVQYIVSKFIDWVETFRTSATIDECVILCTGDMISGDIHHELQVTNEFPVPVQVVKCAQLFTVACLELAKKFKTVRIEYVTADNHSRLTTKYQFKQGGLNSYNYIIGWMSKEMLSSQPNVKFNLHPVIKQLVTVQNMRYLIMHGMQIKGWAGLPWYGIDRSVSLEAKARMNTDKGFDKHVLGHFHTPLNTPHFNMCGSLSGCDEFDRGQGRSGRACQIAWMVHPKYGETNYNVFYGHHADLEG